MQTIAGLNKPLENFMGGPLVAQNSLDVGGKPVPMDLYRTWEVD